MRSRDVFRITLVVAATLGLVWMFWELRRVLLLVGIAMFLALALEPAVTFLQKFIKSRSAAIAAMVVLLLIFIGLFFASIAPPIADQTQSFIDNLPELREDLSDESTTLGSLERRFDLTKRLESAADNFSNAISNIPKVVGRVFSFVADLLVVLALTVYFLLHAPAMKKEGVRLLPPAKRERVATLSEVVFSKVGGWMEGNLLVSAIAGIVSFIALALIGVPYAAPLAMWVAIADLIPMVGAMLGAVVGVTVAFFSGAGTGVATTIFFLAYQQLENYVIAPRVMKRTVDVSAASVIIAALAGGTLLGPVGVLLAVPAAASLKVIANEVWIKQYNPEPKASKT